jgi:Predicted transcriptional regulators
MLPEIDFTKIGQRIKTARNEKGINQADLGSLIGCSNNHVSHVEVGQTKVSLSMLLKLSLILEKDFDYFLLDTPYVNKNRIINTEIADKLNRCNSSTLIAVSKIIDVLLEQQETSQSDFSDYMMLGSKP